MTKIIGSAALAPGGDSGTDLTNKGDLHGYSTENTRIPISTNNFSLLADSAQALGLKWAASPTSILSAQGDLLYASAANTLARLAKGTAAQVLTMNSGATAPEWASAGGGKLELLTSWTGGSGTSPTFSADMETTYSELLIVANLNWITPYTEFGEVFIKLNGIASGYANANGYYYDGTSNTNLTKAGSTVGFVSDTAMDLVSGEGLHIETTLAQVDGTTNIISIHSYCNSGSVSGVSMVLDTWVDLGSTSIITDLHYQATLAGWGSASNIAIFGRKFT